MNFITKKIKIIIISTLVLTLPINIFFALWTTNTLHTYFIFDHIKPSLSVAKGPRFYRVGKMQFISIKEELLSLIGIREKSDINIYIDKNNYQKIKDNPLDKENQESKAYLLYDDIFFKGKTKLRGDNYYHWAYPHKSWRFKTSKKNLFYGIHKNNFMILKSNGIFANHLAYKLANNMGLLAPESSLVKLGINNSNNGLKIAVSQIDEGFLRSKRRMPNDIYKGDNVAPKKYLGIAVPDIFEKPSIWEKSSYNNHYDKNSKIPLYALNKSLNTQDHEILNLESFSSLMVFIDLISSLHYDAQHNWVLSYDHYYEQFYPVIWDPLAWHKEWIEKKHYNITAGSKLLINLYSDYQFLIKKYDIFYTFLNNKQNFVDLLDEAYKETIKKLDTMRYSYKAGGEYRDIPTVTKDVENLKKDILGRLDFLEDVFFGRVNNGDYFYSIIDNKIRLSINGNKLIKKIIIKYKNDFIPSNVKIGYLKNRTLENYNIDYYLNTKEKKLILEQKLLAKTKNDNKQVIFEEATYDINIPELSHSNIENISLEFQNNLNEVIQISERKNITIQKFTDQHNIIQKDTKSNEKVSWSGIKTFSGFTKIKEDIIIAPGTRIIFDENATLKILGKVIAIGTKENPIIFEAKDKIKPWNAFALKDSKANGSIFKHCIFKDGSGDKGELYEYTAMFSVHNVKDLLVENCEFYDSHRTDDMIHVIYSDATFINSKFVRSLSDALDVDISNVVVDNCEFIDSGNDSIDLMTTNAVVINTKFTNSKDKGISIGEGSNLIAINNHIYGSEIGMQSKDTSKAYIYNTSFIKNKKAVDAYHKNWRYNKGGTIILDQCLFEKNIVNATVGKKSKVVINSSDIDTPNQFDTKSLKKKKIIIKDDGPIEYDLEEPLFKGKTHLINKTRRGYHE